MTRALVAAVAALALLAPPAAAAPPPDLRELLACQPYPSGDTICSGVVPSFDGSPLDVDLTLPRRGGASKGLMVMLHGFGNDKHYWESNTDEGDERDTFRWNNHWFARHGYYVLTYTARGFRTEPAPGNRPPTPPAPNGSASEPNGDIQLKSRDWEIRDTQWLAALVAAAYPDVDEKKVAVTGNSYGGGESWTLSSQAVWDFPAQQTGGQLPVLELQVAIPKYGWTDLGYSLAPNGHPGGPARNDEYLSSIGQPESDSGDGFPIGTPKESYVTGFYGIGLSQPFGFEEGLIVPAPVVEAREQQYTEEPPISVTAWYDRVQVDPYDVAGAEDELIRGVRAGLTEFRGAFYQESEGGAEPAAQEEGFAAQQDGRKVAIFAPQGWNDDLFPAVEAFRQFKHLKALDPLWPVEIAMADVGHPRAQNPHAQWLRVNHRAFMFLQEHINGSHEQETVVSSQPTICATDQESDGAARLLTARTPEDLANGQLTVNYRQPGVQTLGSGTGDPDGLATDPVVEGVVFPRPEECRESAAPQYTGRYTAYSEPLPRHTTYIGLGHVRLPYTLVGNTATLNARVWDVGPDGTALLMTRGTYRFSFPAYDEQSGEIRLPLFGNHWELEPGHRIRLDLASVDHATFKPNTENGTVVFAPPTLVLPTRSAQGGLELDEDADFDPQP